MCFKRFFSNGFFCCGTPDLFWKELFIKSFVAEKSDDKQDDLLFFIYKLNSKLVSKMRNCAEPVVSVKWTKS